MFPPMLLNPYPTPTVIEILPPPFAVRISPYRTIVHTYAWSYIVHTYAWSYRSEKLIWIILLTALVFIVICLAKIVTFNTETASKCGGAPSFMESSVLCCSWICTNWMCMGYLVHSKYIQCPSHENIVAKLHRHHKDKASWGAVNVWMSSPPFSSNKILFPTFTIRLQFSIECASLNGSQVSKCYPNFIMCHWIFEHYHEFQLYSIMC